ncbi:MAG TPA: AAA family ATPase, partial [Actinomycetota bacterium]|nr:AAA family ATPase [Actinomycetota bacterium]
MDSASTAGSAPPAATPVSYPVFAAVAVGITGRTVYEVIELVGRIFEAVGAVFEGSPDAPGTLIALLTPSDRAAMQAVQLGLQAQAAAPNLRIGIDATEVHAKKEQDAKWQQVIDSAVRLQKAARSGEVIAGDELGQLTQGGAATESLRVGDETYLLLTGVRELSAVPDPSPPVAEPAVDTPAPVAEAPQPTAEAPDPVASVAPEPVVVMPEPLLVPAEPRDATPPADGPPTSFRSFAPWDAPLIGRDPEIADLRARFERTVVERSASCVIVAGEPGVGRTRLVRDLAGSLGDARALSISCPPPESGGARWPLAPIVEALTGLDARTPMIQAHARLQELFAGQPDAARVLPHLAALVALDGATDPDQVAWALRRLVEVTIAGHPTLLQIDDADRAPAGFVRLLADVAGGVRDASLLIVLTMTRETDGVPCIRLAHLPAEDAALLVGELLGAADDGVAAAIAARAGGNPLALEQALATLAETGTLAPGQGRWLAMADLSQVPLPDGSLGMIRQRLQTLPPHELAVLGTAAVAGERLDVEPLLDVVPTDARAGVPTYLADLVARGYLVADGADSFRFRHHRFRDAVLAGVPDWAQAAAHERFGRYAERISDERMWRHADEIGDHLVASCRLRPDAPEADGTDALELLTWSAAAAVSEGDLDGAARLERRAAALLDDDPARRAELLYLAADHGALAAPERPADREIAEAALAASVVGDDVDWRVRLLRARLRTTAGHDDALEGARNAADEAIAAFADDEQSWALSRAWALRGLVHAARAQNGMVADDLIKAADHAAATSHWQEETAALRGAAVALLDGPVAVGEAEARCESFLPRVRGPLAEHDVRGALALLRARRAAFDEARGEIARCVAALDELGAGSDLAVALHRAAQIEVLAGQPQAAEPQMQRGLAAAAHARNDALRAYLASSLAHILVVDDDRLDEALALAEVAEAHADDIPAQVGWRTARARVMVRRGRGAQAERLVREGLSLAEQTDSTDLRANALVQAADVRRLAGRPAEAEPF